jgi:hypothetical protein
VRQRRNDLNPSDRSGGTVARKRRCIVVGSSVVGTDAMKRENFVEDSVEKLRLSRPGSHGLPSDGGDALSMDPFPNNSFVRAPGWTLKGGSQDRSRVVSHQLAS